jgi:hypothetical protein
MFQVDGNAEITTFEPYCLIISNKLHQNQVRTTGSHLLIHCSLASGLWHSVLRSFGVVWVFPDNIINLLYGWYNCFGKHNSSVWNLVPLCLMWIIWRERNSRVFEDKDQSQSKLIELFFGTLFDWARVGGFTSALSLADFVVSLSFS